MDKQSPHSLQPYMHSAQTTNMLDPEKASITSAAQRMNLATQNSKKDAHLVDSDLSSLEGSSIGGKADRTHRKLKPRHIQLIGIGGTIGTALYVQIGKGLINGGPGSLFLAFTIW